jgi:cation diffusion facilitator family transporter
VTGRRAVATVSAMSDGTRSAIRVSILGLVTNTVLGIVKLTAGLVGHSSALVADAIESILDMTSSTIVLGGLSIAARPPDENHPYGHGKAEALAALGVALLLIGAAVGVTIHAAVGITRGVSPPSWFTLPILFVIVLVKESLYRLAWRVGTDAGSTAVKADAWHHRADSLSSLTAAIGIAVAILGGERYNIADPLAAVVVAVIIAVNGLRLVRPALADLMDAEPAENVAGDAAEAARSVPGVREVEKVFARKMGLTYLVDMHIEVDGGMSVRDAHDLAHRAKQQILEECPRVRDALIHIEPHPRGPEPASS